MTMRFVLVSGGKSPTREEVKTVLRPIGEDFLERAAGGHECRYAGYIVYEGQFVPQWITNDPSLQSAATIDKVLKSHHYVGKLLNW